MHICESNTPVLYAFVPAGNGKLLRVMQSRTIDFSRLFFLARGALQPLLYSWLLFLVFALLFYATTASAPMLGNVTWADAARFTTCLWSTAFGGRCSGESEGYVQLMPLSLTFAVMYALYVILRRRVIHSWGEVALVACVQAGVTALIGAAMGVHGQWWISIAGSAAISGVCAVVAAREYLFYSYSWWEYACEISSIVLRILKLLAFLSILVFLVACAAGASRIASIHASYFAGLWGGIGLVLLQLLYLPTVVIWAMNWLLGAGFSIGTGTYFSIFGTTLNPLPAIPIFGALPQNNAWAVLALAPVVTVFIWRAYKDSQDIPLRDSLRATTIAAAARAMTVLVCVAILVAAASWLARGSLGPERMAYVGSRAELTLAAVVLTFGIPYVTTSIRSVRRRMMANSRLNGEKSKEKIAKAGTEVKNEMVADVCGIAPSQENGTAGCASDPSTQEKHKSSIETAEESVIQDANQPLSEKDKQEVSAQSHNKEEVVRGPIILAVHGGADQSAMSEEHKDADSV
ncbi:Uncharacterised protein [Chlamydia trachomatis]|nr:Uncharacterised protein [Chlamydia trachomatis]